ncbi:TetR/AcrR family transcriptional regulator [Streptosporangium pseudovulgare]|uniref:TetR family transcriptional regulator n=1 Tax=Streptosporangium pseudovulgare TaxID=35765 RepID=A0ABQ2QHR6_9ACTN|nr:TetR/AcrR family transcriptional regulator [Streptosporangium pseudovulgare]GGP81114.1 TetR family transcriptional regulator [Streptosporangium pseudovulgare]
MAQGRAGDPDHGVELLWREAEREPRPGLSLRRIVRAAIELADAEGLEGLSMRKVADRLGFTTMSLYRHVPGRDQLVDLMRDEVLGEVLAGAPEEGPGAGGSWRERLAEVARQGWELRGRHPWLAEVRGSRHLPGPNAVAHYDYMLGTLTGTALRPSEVIAVIDLLGRFVDAEALLLAETRREERRSGVSEQDWWGARDSLYERLGRYPTLTRLWETGGWDRPEDSFAFGLRRLLDGVEVLVRERENERDETRDETRPESCPECGTLLDAAPSGRPRVYCSRACRQRAYRRRRADA